jgi:galacturan 1,4-alpha-galacturonidase
MRLHLTSVLTIVSATLAVASPAWQAESHLVGNKVQRREATETDDGSVRPTVTYSPFQPRLPPPVHGERDKICHVRYNHNQPGADDSDHVMDAMRRCNDGGHVIFSPGVTYNIAKALDLTFLKHIDIGTNSLFDFSESFSNE